MDKTKLKAKATKDLSHDLAKIAGIEVTASDIVGTPPLYHSSDITSRMREDGQKSECLTQEQALLNAKVKKNHRFYTLKTFNKNNE